jgi:CRP/FNR family transcriptional regulator
MQSSLSHAISPKLSPPGQAAGRGSYATSSVSLGDVCDLLQIAREMPQGKKEPRFEHIMVPERQRVFTHGQCFEALYVVKSGFLKTILPAESEKEQVLDFPMKGDVLGIDGICNSKHVSEAVALSDADIILIPFRLLKLIGLDHPGFEGRMYSVLGRALSREQTARGMLAALSAEARVARFLMMLGDRYAAMGYSSKMFNLRMTRAEMGSYLNLALETVSRILSALAELGFISVDQRTIGIKDREALRTLHRLPAQFARQRMPRRCA